METLANLNSTITGAIALHLVGDIWDGHLVQKINLSTCLFGALVAATGLSLGGALFDFNEAKGDTRNTALQATIAKAAVIVGLFAFAQTSRAKRCLPPCLRVNGRKAAVLSAWTAAFPMYLLFAFPNYKQQFLEVRRAAQELKIAMESAEQIQRLIGEITDAIQGEQAEIDALLQRFDPGYQDNMYVSRDPISDNEQRTHALIAKQITGKTEVKEKMSQMSEHAEAASRIDEALAHLEEKLKAIPLEKGAQRGQYLWESQLPNAKLETTLVNSIRVWRLFSAARKCCALERQ